MAHSSDALLARASRGVRWGSLFAIGLCLLLFANCTGNVTSSPTAQVSNAIQDPTRFWTLTAGSGHVAQAPGGWTYVTASQPGQLRIAARFSLARALGIDGFAA